MQNYSFFEKKQKIEAFIRVLDVFSNLALVPLLYMSIIILNFVFVKPNG